MKKFFTYSKLYLPAKIILLTAFCFVFFQDLHGFADNNSVRDSKSNPNKKPPFFADGCAPISTLPCEDLQVNLPFNLSFNASVANTIADRNGLGTGFTMVSNYSGTRLQQDGVPANTDAPAYVVGKIFLGGGRLNLVTNKGLAYRSENNQLNTLGVKVDTRGKLNIETSIINPFYGTASQHAGIWFGLNDKTFLKLVITANKIQLRKEVNDVSSNIVGTGNPDERTTPTINSLFTKTVRLRLIIDPVTNTAEGFYSVDGINYISTGNGYPAKTISIASTGLTGSTAYAGIYATHRNGTSVVSYTFDSFSITGIDDRCLPVSTLPCPNVLVNLPLSLTFDAAVRNTLADKNGLGTGFTMADSYSGTRLSQDGSPANSGVPGYEASKLTLNTGKLQVVSNKGIAYLTGNNQINALGVKVDSRGKLQIETTILKPFYGTQSQQAGIWFGLNDKTYLKLVITANRVELRREINNVSSNVTATSNPDLRITSAISGLSTKNVRLRLVIDPATGTAEGFYSTDGTTYNNTGNSYPTKTLSTAGMGITITTAYAGIIASHRNGSTAVTYSFDNFSVQSLGAPVINSIAFNPTILNFTVLANGAVQAQSVQLSANQGTPSISLSKTPDDWLTLPTDATENINFGPANISSDLPPGKYHATVTASANGYESAVLLINLTVVEPLEANEVKINFQDPGTVPPLGWLRDYGQPFGKRTAQYQGMGMQYGWKRRSDNSLLDLSVGGPTPGNGRNRGTPSSSLLKATLMHMQANDLGSTFKGTPIEGYWEAKVLNGVYDVTVTAGDASVNPETEIHSINVEGTSVISGFAPSGSAGSSTRFKSATVRVTVNDELLTINADGGTNTKINSSRIVPVSTGPYLFWSDNKQNLLIEKGTSSTNTFNLGLNNSSDTHTAGLNYTLSVSYGAGASGWLGFNTTHSSINPTISFNYTAAKNLSLGTYTATIKAVAAGFSSAEVLVQVSVVDPSKPYVITSNPANGDAGVSVNTVSIAANNLNVPEVPGFKGGVDNSTITNTTVQVLKVTGSTTTSIMGVVQGTGGGDAISFSPSYALEPTTVYKFVITDGVKSFSGASFIPYEATFTTGEADTDTSNNLNVEFTKIPIPGTQNKKYTSLTFGPDGKFYALTIEGVIERYTVNHEDGSLTDQQLINTLVNKHGERSAIGLTFSPQSTAANLIAWVSHSSSGLTSAPSFDGNISMLSGFNLETEQLMVTKLPRSTKDHLVNGLAFGPDGALYISQGSNSSMGDYDGSWKRNESLLSGAMLRLDMQKLNAVTLPLNVQTSADQNIVNSAPQSSMLMSDGKYNPYATSSPLTIYASGVRNAYDLLWHTNGQLYVPANGSGGSGSTPASVAGSRRPNGTFYDGPVIATTTGAPVQNDWLFRVSPIKPVGYFGHPNPLRGEFVANRGFTDNPLYPADVTPDANYRPAAFNFEHDKSPNGVIEYKSNTFNGALKGKILVCRFSGGGDIIVLKPGSMVKDPSINSPGIADGIYDIVQSTTGSGTNGLIGMSGFANPLDIIEDVTTGNLYVSEFNWNNSPTLTSQITLLKVGESSSQLASFSTVSPQKLSYSHIVDGTWGDNQTVTIANTGNGILKVTDIQLVGKDAKQFNIIGTRTPGVKEPVAIPKNSSISFNVSFNPSSLGSKSAVLRVVADDNPVKEITLRGFGTAYEGEVADKMTIADMPAVKDKSIDDIAINEKVLKVYPNPNTGERIKIELRNFARQEPIVLTLYDESGRLIQKLNRITDDEGILSTEILFETAISPGLYIVSASALSGTKQSKLIIQ